MLVSWLVASTWLLDRTTVGLDELCDASPPEVVVPVEARFPLDVPVVETSCWLWTALSLVPVE